MALAVWGAGVCVRGCEELPGERPHCQAGTRAHLEDAVGGGLVALLAGQDRGLDGQLVLLALVRVRVKRLQNRIWVDGGSDDGQD